MNDCPFRYQGQYEDVETGLYYNRFRYYSPDEGNYISVDPIGVAGGFQVYKYVNDPNRLTDGFGLYAGEGIRDLGVYHSFYDAQLPSSMHNASDAKHFREGNKQLFEAMEQDPKLKQTMMKKYPGVVDHVAPGPRGGHKSTSPPGLTWHHNDKPGVLELVDRNDHNTFHKVYHPDGSGGKKKWGGGRKKRLKRKAKVKCK